MGTTQERTQPEWADLLRNAVTTPGVISEAYRQFHGYSVGNQMLALLQCSARGITPGPIGTFQHWKELGRFVRKGEKAIQLCMPVTCKRSATQSEDHNSTDTDTITFTRFVYRNNWFVVSQTDGAEYQYAEVPGWDATAALAALDITRVEFAQLDGNCQGYATGRMIAINPVAALPQKTMFHELAHVMLGHTAEAQLSDSSERTPKDIRELEAECVALLCCESLGLPGAEFCRGYIQNWYHGNEVPERSAQRIFHAADQILKAGRA